MWAALTTNSTRYLKVIILILIILALLLYIAPDNWIPKFNTKLGKYMEISRDYENMLQNFKVHDSLEKKKSRLLDEISRVNVEAKILQEEIITNLYGHCLENNITITKINFSEVIPVYLDNAENSNEDNKDETAVTVHVTVEFKSNYCDMLELIDNIKNDDRDIAVIHMRLLSSDGIAVMGIMDLNFYAMPFISEIGES